MAETTNCHGKVSVGILTFGFQSADAHFLSSFYNFVYAYFASEANGRNVHGTGDCSTQANFTVPFFSYVSRSPVFVKFFFFIFHNTCGGKAICHTSQINEGFEGRTRLTDGKSSTVKFILTTTTEHCFYMTGVGVDSNKCYLRLSKFVFIVVCNGMFIFFKFA